MRILYLGSTSSNACASFYADAAEQLGHQVFRWDPQLFKPNHLLESFLIRWNKSPLSSRIEFCTQEILSKCKELKIELIINLAENFLSGDFLRQVKSLPAAPQIVYHSHDNNFSSGILKPSDFFETLKLYDSVFTTKSQNLQRYRMLGQSFSFYIPSAFEPRFHRPIPQTESKFKGNQFPITFIGTYDKSRDKFLNALDWDNLHVWGDCWTKFRGYSKHKDHIIPKAIYHPDFADILSHSEITLGLLREEAEDRHTQRTFEIPACGAFQIAPRNDEILSFFKEDKEIVCFDSIEEMKDKISYYLKHPTQRAQIAKEGYERVLRGSHTYKDRVKTILEKVSLTK
jgi:spore maturation protein CgeB